MSCEEQDLTEFKTEALELLDNAEKSLLEIGSATEFKVIFDSVFRCFHNLKGAAGMMDLSALQSLMHELETTLMKFKDGPTIPKDFVGHFLQGIDSARRLIDWNNSSGSFEVTPPSEPKPESEASAPQVSTPESPRQDPSSDQSNEQFFAECGEIIERVAENLKRIESGQFAKENIDALYRDFHSLKGTAYLFSFNQLGEISHIIESSLEPVRDSGLAPQKSLINGIYSALKIIEIEIQCLRSGKSNEKIKESIAALNNSLTRLKDSSEEPQISAKLDGEKSSELIADLTSTHLQTKKLAQVSAIAPTTPQTKEKELENSSIRVPVALLDNLMTLMGEMVLVRNQVLQFSNNSDDLEFSNLSKRLNAVTSEIQDQMMKTRMQPIGNVLSKFTRVVRDLSQDLGKQISLNLIGAETELDKSLLEAIKDPLTHIVRNSCDHGIETPDVRVKAGKPEAGTISINSFHEGGQVVIQISDDGKGLSKEVLLKKGIEKGLIDENKAKTMAEKEIFNLIFAPGFSTAQKVTNVSGRGVGMDVVRTNIDKIGGTVDLMSVTGKGTTILIKIPLTLAIVPALIVNCGTGIFAIPQVKLVELVRVDQSQSENKIEYLQGSPVYRLRGNLLPLLDLNKILKIQKEESKAASPFINIAVLNAENRSFGLIVDEVHDTADIVVKPLNRLLKSLQVYSGATILGDGNVALILDVIGLSKYAQIGHGDQESDPISVSSGALTKKQSLENQEYILVKLNSPTKHAIVLGYVHRLEEFKRSDFEFTGNKKVIRYRNSLLHIVTANHTLGYPESEVHTNRDTIPIIVVERGGLLFGIEVDEIIDTLSSSVDPDTSLTKQNGIFGNLNTESELIVVIDPFELISAAYPGLDQHIIPNSNPSLASQNTTRKLKILLAEDTVFFKRAISKVLEKAGHEITHANDGQEAFELFEKGSSVFDLIISDIEMPRMDGFMLAKAVRASKSNPQIPMLAISSKANAAYRNKGMSAGFGVYLEKLKPEILLNAVNELSQNTKRIA